MRWLLLTSVWWSAASACGDSASAVDASPDAPARWTVRQLGTNADDVATNIGVDAACAIYLAGTTRGNLGATPPVGLDDVFVLQLPASGDGWRVQLGSAGTETAGDMVVTPEGVATIVGTTDGALPGAQHHGRDDIFVASFDPAGALRWVTESGSGETDQARALARRSDGTLVVAGMTNELAVENFDLRIDTMSDDGKVLATAAIRSDTPEFAEGIAFDANDRALIVGGAFGPLAGEWRGSADPYVLRVPVLGEAPTWAEQRGTADIDAALDVEVDPMGNIYVLATSYSDLDSGAYENDGRQNAFVIKYRPGEPAAVWIRRIGPANHITSSRRLAVDTAGNVYIAGATDGDLEGVNAGGLDAFLTILDTDGAHVHTTQLGTAGDDRASDVIVTESGEVLIAGATQGALAGPGTHVGAQDAFVARFPALAPGVDGAASCP